VVLLADRVPAGIAEEHVDLACPERVLGPHQDRDHEPSHQVAGEQADGAAAAGEQATGERVGAEREALSGVDHPLPRGGRHLVAAVERLGGRGQGDTREAGDVGERHRPLRPTGAVDGPLGPLRACHPTSSVAGL
jgi:hypothetical protein